MQNVNQRFMPPTRFEKAYQWAGQPGVGPIYFVPGPQRALICWNDLPFCPPAPWYITERPIFIPGQGYVLTTNNPLSANPQASVAP